MRLFLDTSTLLAAAGSAEGASREIFRRAQPNDWTLLVTPYVLDEVRHNLPRLSPTAADDWTQLRPHMVIMDDILTLDQIAVFEPAKDRPILFSALAWADILLTLDKADFGALLGKSFYGLEILRPGSFLEKQRSLGKLK